MELSALLKKTKKNNECLEFIGRKGNGGYGVCKHEGKEWRTHRLVYYLVTGIHPSNLFVCHHCDNPPCINPAHLFLGTSKDNHYDMMKKGRGPTKLNICKRGHPLTIENAFVNKKGHRQCKICSAMRGLRSYHRRRSEGKLK